ncbi:LOW QUALITY PROTEIN: uncharacterized protein WCC33_005133 [Rhinophrynus dorsalis]
MSMQSALQKLSSSLAESFTSALKGTVPLEKSNSESANLNPMSTKQGKTLSNSLEKVTQTGRKCTSKRHYVNADNPLEGNVSLSSDADASEQCGLVPHIRSSPPEDTNGGDQNLRRLPSNKKNLRRLQPDSYYSSSTEESSDEDWAPSYEEEDDSDVSPSKKRKSSNADSIDSPSTSTTPTLLDARGDPMFDPEGIKHPRSSDWTPRPNVAQYLETWVRKPISRATRSKLRAECPRPVIANRVCETPELDPKMVQFIAKSGKDPRRGVDQALKSCQDKLLDSLGPLTKIFELSEEALQSKKPIDVQVLRGWVQRAICMIGNANSAIASERRRALLLRIDPKLAEMANSEPGPSAKGQLFGDTFIKDLGKFVAFFTALDKAQISLRKVNIPQLREVKALSFQPVADLGEQDRVEDFHGDALSPADAALVDNEISTLWRKRAIKHAYDPRVGFVSNIFLVRKKDSGLRPVINLRTLNGCVLYRHFKMEGIHLLRDLLLPSDWMVKIDLQDAYLTVPMYPSSQIYLRFLWRNKMWQFTCLPFGLLSAPWCFTKLMKPVVAFLRSRGFRFIIYLDYILIMSQDPKLLLRQTNFTIHFLSDLGFLVNWKKSQLIPSQRLEFLGFTVDSRETSLSLPKSKIKSIRREICYILRQDRISLRLLARVVGLLAASIQAIFPGPLHYRALQRLKARHLRRGLGYTNVIALSYDAREELVWWLKHLDAWNGRAIFGVIPDLVIESDASLLGWGARLGDISTGGRWSSMETSLHINCLELLAGSFALKSLVKDRVHSCVLLKMDNISAVQYINKLGGTKSKPLADLAKDFWHFCLDRDITVVAEHLPGLSNAVADWNSRYLTDHSDWKLHPSIFAALHRVWGPFGIDLFASRLNRQVPKFFSWRPDPEALATDAFLQSWTPGLNYAFLPFAMIPRTLLMIRQQAASVVVVTPFWPTQPWFPPLLELSVDFPRLIPTFPLLLTDPYGDQGFSESAQTLLAESWAPGTRTMYRSAWSAWSRWCVERDLDPVSTSPINVVNFLSVLFDSGKAYRTINSYRSAISAGHIPVDGIPIGQSVLVCRLMRGIRFSRPQSRYQSLWNVNDVLHFLEVWPTNNLLSLKQLSAKLTMLLCLVSLKRVSDVRALDFHSRSFTPQGVQFRVSRCTKTAVRTVSYPAFPSQPQLCVVKCLQEYEIRTYELRSPSCSQLLISFLRPHLPVSTATLARWVR